MDGDITASSRPQKGSLFTLRLPLTVADAQDAGAQPGAWPPGAAPPGRRARVLLAEDHPTNRLVVELMLRAGEVDLVSVENGAQAIEASREQDFDCILMDMEMPVMDGLTAIREIRRREGVQGSAPVTIFALSAHTSEDHKQLSSAAGADGHLTKPIHPDALLKALGQALASRGAVTAAPAAERPGVALFSG
jgi:CheY-like chemotaxis protein